MGSDVEDVDLQDLHVFCARMAPDDLCASTLTRYDVAVTDAEEPLLNVFMESYRQAYPNKLSDFIDNVAAKNAPLILPINPNQRHHNFKRLQSALALIQKSVANVSANRRLCSGSRTSRLETCSPLAFVRLNPSRRTLHGRASHFQ